MMAMELFATSGTLDAAHSEKDAFRARTYKLLLDQPCVPISFTIVSLLSSCTGSLFTRLAKQIVPTIRAQQVLSEYTNSAGSKRFSITAWDLAHYPVGLPPSAPTPLQLATPVTNHTGCVFYC